MSAAGAMPESRGFYVPYGGTMKSDARSYVARRADDELVSALRDGHFCYVLSARQMGKSSLMVRSAARLAEAGISTVQIDLSPMGDSVAPEQWYFGIAHQISKTLDIPVSLEAWWEERITHPVTQRLTDFLREQVLGHCSQNVVIFVDEIDTTIKLPFSDDFFAAVRNVYNSRAAHPIFERLTIVLLGVATPSELIKDPARTPFNIGRPIQLSDFSHDEAQPLARWLHDDAEVSSRLLHRILYWTDGHPYLTQNLCSNVAENNLLDVDELVRQLFLSRPVRSLQDPNLQIIRERLTRGTDYLDVLRLYLEVLTRQVVKFDPNSPIHASLVLAGVVKASESGELKVRNRIYRRVFSDAWVRSVLPLNPQILPAIPGDIQNAYVVYSALRKSARFRSQAIASLAEFWESKAARDEAILTRLRQWQENQNPETWSNVSNLIGLDYSRLITTCVHDDAVLAAVVGPSGAKVLTASADRTARVWSTFSGERLSENPDTGVVRACAFSPSGVFAASGGDSESAFVWSVGSGLPYGHPMNHGAGIRALAFSPNGSYLFTAGTDGRGILWDLPSGEWVYAPLEHPYSVLSAEFSPSGKTILAAGKNKSALLWRVDTGELVAVLTHSMEVTSFAFSPNEDAIVTGGADGVARVWSTKAGSPLTHEFPHGGAILSVAFSPSGKWIATGGSNRTALLWRLDSGNLSGKPMRHFAPVQALQFSPAGDRILTGAADGTARLWSTYTCQPVSEALRHGAAIESVSFSPDGYKLLTRGGEWVRLWSALAFNDESKRRAARRSPGEILFASLSEDGSRVIAASVKGEATLWLAHSEELEQVIDFQFVVTAAAFTPDATLVATGGDDGSVRIWQSDSGQLLHNFECHQGEVLSLDFSPDGSRLLSAGIDKTAQLIDIQNHSWVGAPRKHRFPVRILRFSPDALSFVSVGGDTTTRFWLSFSGDFLGSITHSSRVNAVAWKPDSKSLLVGMADGLIECWQVPNPTTEESSKIFELQCHAAATVLAFHPQNEEFVVLTENWLYYYRIAERDPVLLCSRLLEGRWVGGIRWNAQQASLELLLSDTPDAVYLTTVKLRSSEDGAEENMASDLVADWQRRLGRSLSEDAKVTPAYTRRLTVRL